MAHLACVEHGRRVLVIANQDPDRKIGDTCRTLHRSDGTKCGDRSGAALKSGKVKLGSFTVLAGLTQEYKATMLRLAEQAKSGNAEKTKVPRQRKPRNKAQRA